MPPQEKLGFVFSQPRASNRCVCCSACAHPHIHAHILRGPSLLVSRPPILPSVVLGRVAMSVAAAETDLALREVSSSESKLRRMRRQRLRNAIIDAKTKHSAEVECDPNEILQTPVKGVAKKSTPLQHTPLKI
jgi:hypothetical protein